MRACAINGQPELPSCCSVLNYSQRGARGCGKAGKAFTAPLRKLRLNQKARAAAAAAADPAPPHPAPASWAPLCRHAPSAHHSSTAPTKVKRVVVTQMQWMKRSITCIFDIISTRASSDMPPADTRVKAGGGASWRRREVSHCCRPSCCLGRCEDKTIIPCMNRAWEGGGGGAAVTEIHAFWNSNSALLQFFCHSLRFFFLLLWPVSRTWMIRTSAHFKQKRG
jgi:hypothetical protein